MKNLSSQLSVSNPKDFCIIVWHICVVLTFKSIIITFHHSHLKTLSLSDFMYSYMTKFLRVKKQLSCLLTFLEDYCITVWQINAVFTFKSIIITSSHSHKKHLSLSVFTHSYMMKIRNNHQRKWTTQLSVNNCRRFLHHSVTNSSYF